MRRRRWRKVRGWECSRRRCLFVVDCQPVQRVSAGMAPLRDAVAQPVFEGVCANLVSILGAGWAPPKAWDDPVIWRRREKNIVADFLVNRTMDSRLTWSKHVDLPASVRSVSDCNVVVHSDGGTRAGSCSATGWVVEVGSPINGVWQYSILAISGTFISTPISSFLAEALALEEATLFVKKLVTV